MVLARTLTAEADSVVATAAAAAGVGAGAAAILAEAAVAAAAGADILLADILRAMTETISFVNKKMYLNAIIPCRD